MNATERAAALKVLEGLSATIDGKVEKLTAEEMKGLELNSDKGLARLRDLAGKSPADAIIQAKANADAALAAHAHGLNAKDQADAAKKAEAAKVDDESDEEDDDEKDGKKRAAQLKAAQAAGFETIEQHEEAKWLDAHPAVKRQVTAAAAAEKAEKDDLIASLKGLGAATEEQLKTKTVEQLRELASFAKVAPKPRYDGQTFPRSAEGGNDPFLNPPDPYAAGLKALRARRGEATN